MGDRMGDGMQLSDSKYLTSESVPDQITGTPLLDGGNGCHVI